MKIRILGTASGMPVAHRSASSLAVESGNSMILLDCGDGAARQCIRFHYSPHQIDRIYITHTHPDHAAGIFTLLQWMHLRGRERPVKLFVPGDNPQKMKDVLAFFQIYTEKYLFDIICLPIRKEEAQSFGNIRVEAIANTHLTKNQDLADQYDVSAKSYSLILSDASGQVIYTSDVNDLDHLQRIKGPFDLLISEMTHLRVETMLVFAKHHHIPKIYFTHIPAEIEAKGLPSDFSEKPVQVHFAQDGDVIEV